MTKRVKTKILVNDPQHIPMYRTAGSAAADLVANIPVNHNGERLLNLMPGNVETIDLGFSIEVPEGYEAQIRARSGLAQKGIQVTNGIGTIDSDYRGPVKVILNNAGREIVPIRHGDRVAQLVIQPVLHIEWQVVQELSDTERGAGGFGSTGK